MASAVDTYSDLEISDEEEDNEVDILFNKASEHVKKLVANLESGKLLQLYGLYKQATIGPCNIPRPSWYEMQAKQKWDAWNSLRDISKVNAKEKYIKLVQSLDPDWANPGSSSSHQTAKQQWVTVSTLSNVQDYDTDESVFDFCRKGDLEKVKEYLKENPKVISETESGLGLIHWAVDRGHKEMLQLLLTNNCDISMKDECGQTALHYAASCGHYDCVTLLLEHGANRTLLDNDGVSALDCAAPEVKHLL